MELSQPTAPSSSGMFPSSPSTARVSRGLTVAGAVLLRPAALFDGSWARTALTIESFAGVTVSQPIVSAPAPIATATPIAPRFQVLNDVSLFMTKNSLSLNQDQLNVESLEC
jgi:hypothetical protein